jgi:hypothetical protein
VGKGDFEDCAVMHEPESFLSDDGPIDRTNRGVALLFNVSEIVSAPAQVWPPRRGRVLQDGPELSILVCLSTRIMSLLGSAARAETLQPGSNPGTRLRERCLGRALRTATPDDLDPVAVRVLRGRRRLASVHRASVRVCSSREAPPTEAPRGWQRIPSRDAPSRGDRVLGGRPRVPVDAAWGAKPRTLFVPTEEAWDDVVPGWLRGRRDVVLQRLAAATKHRIEATDDPMREQELRPVSVDEARAIGMEWLRRMEARSGPWTIEAFEETEAGWRLTYRLLEPERYAPAIPDGRFAILVRRETGEIKIL